MNDYHVANLIDCIRNLVVVLQEECQDTGGLTDLALKDLREDAAWVNFIELLYPFQTVIHFEDAHIETIKRALDEAYERIKDHPTTVVTPEQKAKVYTYTEIIEKYFPPIKVERRLDGLTFKDWMDWL